MRNGMLAIGFLGVLVGGGLLVAGFIIGWNEDDRRAARERYLDYAASENAEERPTESTSPGQAEAGPPGETITNDAGTGSETADTLIERGWQVVLFGLIVLAATAFFVKPDDPAPAARSG